MSIKHLALDLYRAQQNVERLEKAIAAALPNEPAPLLEELRGAKAEWQMLRKMLDGEKENAALRARSAVFIRKR